MKIGIVIPSFNEEACLPGLIRQIEAQGLGADICVVDDSPGDAAAAALAGLGLPNLAVIRRGSKGGRGSAVLEGMRYFLKGPCDLVVEMDADLSHPPSRLPGLIKESLERKTDLLIASRYLSGSSVGGRPLLRRCFSRAANGLAALLLGPLLTKKRIFCSYLCPFAAWQAFWGRLNPFRVTLDPALCTGCVKCARACPMTAISCAPGGRPEVSAYCNLCGECLEACPGAGFKYTLFGLELPKTAGFFKDLFTAKFFYVFSALTLGAAFSSLWAPAALRDIVHWVR